MLSTHSIQSSKLAKTCFYGAFTAYEKIYWQLHKAIAIDNFLMIKLDYHRGPTKQLHNGINIRQGDPIAYLHFNNDYLAKFYQHRSNLTYQHIAFRFKAVIIRSLRTLATTIKSNSEFSNIVAFTGITWLQPHGGKLGFEAHPLPKGLRKTLLTVHFRWLLLAMFPQLAERENHRLEPHQFWLSRAQLLQFTGDGEDYDGA